MVLIWLPQMHCHDLVTFNAGPWSVTECMALIPLLSVHGLDFLPLLHGLIWILPEYSLNLVTTKCMASVCLSQLHDLDLVTANTWPCSGYRRNDLLTPVMILI
jgi:hypothetical protein